MKRSIKLLATFALLSVIPQTLHAEFKLVRVRNFNAEYQAPSGTATADEFLVPIPAENGSDQIEMRFFKRDQSYVFVHDDKEYVLKNPPSMLNDVENFTLSQISLISEKSQIKIDLGRADIYAKESETHLRKLAAVCPEKLSNLGPDEKVIDSCTSNANLSLEFGNFKDFKKNLIDSNSFNSILAQLFPMAVENSINSSDVQVTALKVNINNNAFQLNMNISMDISAAVKGSGMVWYLPNEKQVKVRIDVLKASILDVREQIFKAIEKAKNPKIQVQRPYLIISQK